MVIEMIQHMGEIGKQFKLLKLLTKIYTTATAVGHLPGDFVKSAFISVPIKPKVTDAKTVEQ